MCWHWRAAALANTNTIYIIMSILHQYYLYNENQYCTNTDNIATTNNIAERLQSQIHLSKLRPMLKAVPFLSDVTEAFVTRVAAGEMQQELPRTSIYEHYEQDTKHIAARCFVIECTPLLVTPLLCPVGCQPRLGCQTFLLPNSNSRMGDLNLKARCFSRQRRSLRCW